MKFQTISFLSDFGLVDESVGMCKSVIRSIAPDVTVVDITHGVPQFDVQFGSLSLVRAEPFLVPGVVLASVGAGKPIAVEVGDGQSVILGLDNGLLAPLVAAVGGATRVFEVSVGDGAQTFPARDVLSPAAARICSGVDLRTLGPQLGSVDLQPALVPFSEERDGVLHADVIWVDSFGNAQMNVEPEQLQQFGDRIRVELPDGSFTAVRTGEFAQLTGNEVGLLNDAHGMVSLVMNRQSVALHQRLTAGTAVRLKRAIQVS